MARELIIVASMKGGVGKTKMSTFLVDALRGASVLAKAPAEIQGASWYRGVMDLLRAVEGDVLPIDVDVDPLEKVGSSSLSRRVKDTIPYPIGPTDAAIIADVRSVKRHFDRLHELIRKVPNTVVVDMGANVVNSWFKWATDGDASFDWVEDGTKVKFVSMAAPDQAAFKAAADGLEAMADLCAPHKVDLASYLVLNQMSNVGGFERYEGTREWERLCRLKDLATPIDMATDLSELNEAVDASTLLPCNVFAMGRADLEVAFPSLKPMETRRGQKNYLMEWYKPLLIASIDVGLLGGGSKMAAPIAAAPASVVEGRDPVAEEDALEG